MVWVYDRTKSLPVVMLMHAPLAGGQLILMPPAISGVAMVKFDLLFAGALWAVVAVVFLANRGQLSRQRPRTRFA